MKKFRSIAVLMVLGLGLVVRLGADIPFLWLDSPSGRDNPHDPKSALFHATTQPTLPIAPFNSPTPTFTPTPTFSFSASPAGTLTNTPTPSASPSSTPSPSATPTPILPLVLYDGDTAGKTLADGTFSTSTAPTGQAGLSEAGPDGAASTSNYMRLTLTAAAGSWYGEGTYYTAGGPYDASSYDALRFYVRVPSLSCSSSFRPMMQLLSNGTYPSDHSLPVTVTAYIDGSSILGYDAWTQVTIPLSAFLGSNYEAGSFSAADLSSVTGFQVQQFAGSVNNDGSIPPSEVHIDQVQFIKLASLPPVSSLGRLFEDFENPAHTEWNTYKWQVAMDSVTCTPQTSFSFPVGGVGNSPIDSGGNSLTVCHAGHIAGYVNANTSCGPYPYANMAAYFSPVGSGNYVDLAGNASVNFSPATGAHGMIFRMKTSAPNSGQVYLLRLHTKADETANNFDDYKVWISDSSSDLNPVTSTWKTFVATFPANNSSPTPYGGSNTSLSFAQSGWGTPEPWDQSHLEYITIMPNNTGLNYDLWVDDIEFY